MTISLIEEDVFENELFSCARKLLGAKKAHKMGLSIE